MTKSTHALFHSKTLNTALRNFSFPPDIEIRYLKIEKWIETLNAGTLDKVKEVSLHGDFLKDVFQDILGYRSVIQGSGKIWEIHAEQTISDGGGSADAALGFFTAVENKKGKIKLQGRIVAPIELKGTKDDLERPAPGRKESAVDQGWRYANYTPDCKWIIVSNYRELRLYQTSKTPAYYEKFLLTDLVDLEAFKRFYFLLCRQNFLPKDTSQVSTIDRLLSDSSEAQEEITKKLYEEYKAVRLELVKHFRHVYSPDILNRDVLIEKAQKTLDRVLFIAFCEDRGLLPHKTLTDAHDRKDPYHPRPIWDNYKAVFRWVDRGNEDPPIPGYNGGLFQHDPLLDEQLTVTDRLCTQLNRLTRFDFDTEVSVDILGHIFEQSITDLEELKADVAKEYDNKKSKRKTQGVFYTPAFITQYIVQVAVGGYLKQQEHKIRQRFQFVEQQETEIKFWSAYREVLKQTRVIDPACGSGAFLIAAFDYLMHQYERVNQALAALQSTPTQNIELDRAILSNNLFGVDLSPESVEITKLSLWLKTAQRGKTLTYLDNNIKVGNSIVDDADLTDYSFNWQAEFPDVFAAGGFDVVIGNPPYVRQELLSHIKSYLQTNYESYHGVADLYTYFYEKGLKILNPGGMLSYIVTNKWLKSGYGEPLRNFFSQQGVFEQLIDFGHAPIFEDADTFPCIVVVRKPLVNNRQDSCSTQYPHNQDKKAEPFPPPSQAEPGNDKLGSISPVLVCPIAREELANINLTQYVKQNGYTIPWSRFTANAWSLEPPAVDDLMRKIQQVGIPLKDFTGVKPNWGILTGFNEAFLIDEATKNKLIQADPKSAEIIKPYLRGQDIKRWYAQWDGLWIILLKSSNNYSWNWSEVKDVAEEVFQETFPSVYQHLKPFEDKLRKRSDKGRYWWELRSCAYYHLFEQPKLTYQEIQFHPAYSYDTGGYFTNNKGFIIPTADLYVLAVLNSPLMWWHNWRYLPHMKDEALNPAGYLIETLPIAPPTDEIRAEVEPIVNRLIEITKDNREAYRDVLDWLQIEYKIAKLGQKLEDFATLKFEEFVYEVRKRMPKTKSSDPLSPAAFKALRQAYNEYVPAIQSRRTEAIKLEHCLSQRVNQAYQLTPEEIDLMWKTAPPRMPITKSFDEI